MYLVDLRINRMENINNFFLRKKWEDTSVLNAVCKKELAL